MSNVIEPISIYGQLRMGSVDAMNRVVWMSWFRTTHRRERRRWFKKLLLGKRAIDFQPYFMSDARLERKDKPRPDPRTTPNSRR